MKRMISFVFSLSLIILWFPTISSAMFYQKMAPSIQLYTELSSVIFEIERDMVQTAYSNRIIMEEPEVEIIEEISSVIEETAHFYSDEEVDMVATLVMAEAEGESELGKRLVVDTILNRVDSDIFPNTIYDVVYQKNQFTPMWNGRYNRCYVKDDIRVLVEEEMVARTNYDVVFFNSSGFTKYGAPLFQEGGHYFSSLKK